LTIIPVPGSDVERQSDSLIFFPVVGAFIGGLVTLVVWLVAVHLHWQFGAGTSGVIVLTLLTGGLHLDGLADAVDGFGGGHTRKQMLDIMKDTRVGAFGITAIVLSILVKMVSISQLAFLSKWQWIPVPFICSRMILVLLSVILPYARAEGGTAKNIVMNAKKWHFIVAMGLTLLACAALAGPAGLMVFLLALVSGYGIAQWMKHTFGGTTGDLLGMSNELVECMLLFVIASATTCFETLGELQIHPVFMSKW